ncbi:carbohydrate kinase family protein [Streptomyces sp. NBC_00878]|uniref:carbohydrate kinase family protein n=1 Tax=Streptomyces sp. NBC_00878 TaxID=2975854 RepID=UPI002253E72B|nr:carbohydrate kinase family protein [Streptomyces sp. NBC_00878]MCX4903854.1 carbohydrate kinase family protein [Streptomyces sp. NBC_00878]
MGDERPDVRPDVLLTGLLFYDLVLTGLGKPPTPGEEIWTDGMGTSPGGIANLAVAAARYGLRTSLATVFGDDYYGTYCRDVLAGQEHVDLSLSRTADGWHTPVTVSLALPHSRLRSSGGTPMSGGTPTHDRALVTHGQEPPYSQDALMGDPPAARTALVHIEAEPREWLAKAAANGTKIYADVGWDPTQQWSSALLDQLALCHAFVPNDTEAMAYTRTDTAADALSKLSELVPVAVVTRGGDGALAVDQTTGEYADVPALATEVLDATGAGDVFGASFVAASLGGWPLEERLRFAVLAASLSVRRHGGALAAPGWYGVHQWWQSVQNTENTANPENTALRRAYGFLADRLPADPGPPVPHAPVTPPAPHGIPDLP